METVLTGEDAGRPVLVVSSRHGEVGKRVTVDRFPFVIGRGSQAHLALDTERASRAHARIEQVDGQKWRVIDLGSANGTYLNGERITEARALVSGDVIGVGEAELEWHVLSEDGLADGTETTILEPS